MRISVLVVLILVLASACANKDLTEATAKEQVAEALSSRRYMVSVTPLLAQMANSDIDFKTVDGLGVHASMLRTLLERGFVQQQVYVESYPVVSGSWHGEGTCLFGTFGTPEQILDYVLANQNESCWRFGLNVELEPLPNSNEIRGTSDQAATWSRTPALKAFVTSDNEITFTELVGPQKADGRFFYLERGERGFLVSPSGDFLYVGTASRRRTEVKRYSYSFAPQLQTAAESVPVGRVQIIDVTQLLLTTETRATADYRWQVELDEFGKVLLSNIPVGTARAEFAKKPDGTWVLTDTKVPHGSL